ncbi:hypothetical protein EVAR_92697_1 [Eumeta japonica]|uniref:Uncharacterized protein n=1 Tax=Eumeta variegata TaxID=151549 RepID=A0A4C1SWZ0_EUMVA|nr:hypothetical protein EVAR_92697_1 [Eumeta japonica]
MGKCCDGERSGPPELSLTGRKATAYAVIILHVSVPKGYQRDPILLVRLSQGSLGPSINYFKGGERGSTKRDNARQGAGQKLCDVKSEVRLTKKGATASTTDARRNVRIFADDRSAPPAARPPRP